MSKKKIVIKRKVRPIQVQGGKPHLTKTVSVYHPKRGITDLPEGTLVKDVTYYGSKGLRQIQHSVDNGATWSRGFCWSDFPLSEGVEIRYV